MNSNLPPIRKVGPAIAPKPKNIKIHAGRVIRLNEANLTPPSVPPPPPPPPPPLLPEAPPVKNPVVHRFVPVQTTNSNDETTYQFTTNFTLNTNTNNNNKNDRVSLDLPQPPSPSILANLNETDKNNNNTNELHANLYLMQNQNSTINVSSDSSSRPTITITTHSPNQNASLKNINYVNNNDEPKTYNIPIQHIPSSSSTAAALVTTTINNNNKDYQSISNINNKFNNDILLSQNQNNRNLDSLTKQQNITIPVINKNTSSSSSKNAADEVDLVQELLMKNLLNSKDPNFDGICMKCGENILAPDIGLKAMQQIFHAKCFCCVSCGSLLKDKHFYAIDNKPFCEMCYMRLLEKCSICNKAITDRILRATGKPFHPECFLCTMCEKNLDGIPFTVDAANKIHCIDCFHNKYAPRCYMCHLPITPEPGQEETTRIVALDKSFHVQCYVCEDCGVALSSNVGDKISGCYPLDDHIYCRNCNIQRLKNIKIPQSTIINNSIITPRSTDL